MTGIDSRVARRQVIYISEYAREKAPRPPHILDGYIFNDCQISGPGVVLPLENVTMTGCSFPDSDVVFPIEMPRTYYGFIVLKNCTFESCKFQGVGIAGDASFVERFLANIGKTGS
jgi:hypothetical protein